MSNREVEQAILSAGCLKRGKFILASGVRANLKLDLEELLAYPNQLQIVMAALAAHPVLAIADVIMAVPEGAQRLFGESLSKKLGVPLAELRRIQGGSRYDFKFATGNDKKLALAAKHPRIIEDVVTTLGSVAAVARLLDWRKQDVQALAIWRRGAIDPKYARYMKASYLIEKPLPLL